MQNFLIVTILALAIGVAPDGLAQKISGNLIIIGGGDRGDELMRQFAELAGGQRARVVIFPMASAYAHEVGPALVEELKKLGVGEARSLHLTREQANTDSVMNLMNGVTGVFFSGGDQSRLTAALKDTRVEHRLHQLYASGAVMAGTSAGAAVMSEVMITGDQRRPAGDSTFNTIEAGNIVTTEGFGFLKSAIIDQHFVRRRRHNRLLSLVLEKPHLVGVGIDEGTGIWVKPDGTFEVIGAGAVLIYDATGVQPARDANAQGLRAADLRLHVLRQGAVYDLRSKKVKRLEAR
jgi:cyanophycinase